jgi:hypothetical protein
MAPRFVHRKADQRPSLTRDAYVAALLALYRSAPGTLGHVLKADLRLARELHRRGVSLQLVDDALAVALCRRLLRAGAALEPIRTLHYFQPVIDELIKSPLDQDYIQYLRAVLRRTLDTQPAQRS